MEREGRKRKMGGEKRLKMRGDESEGRGMRLRGEGRGRAYRRFGKKGGKK